MKIIVILLIGLLSACGESIEQNNDTDIDTNNGANNSNTTITPTTISFIHLNDVHANLTTHNEQLKQDDSSTVLLGRRGGLARTATLIKQLQTKHQNNAILMNIGDTFHGGAEAMFSNGNAIVDPINALGIDVGVPGNWDYAYGPIVTNARFGGLIHEDVKRPNYLNLAANATYKIPDMVTQTFAQNFVQSIFSYTAGDAFLPATTIIERDGLKIGFIGLTSDIVKQMHELLAFNISFTQGKDNYLALLNLHSQQLKNQGADIVVVMSELGIHKDWEMANSLAANTVNIFFSAHTHETTKTELIANNGTIVVEAGNDSYLGEMNVSFDSNKNITQYEWTLYEVTTDIEEDSEMKSLIATARAPFIVESPNITIPQVSLGNLSQLLPAPFIATLEQSLDAVIGQVSLPLSRRHALENDFNNLYADYLKQATSTDVAITAGFRFDSAVIPHAQDYTGSNAYYWQAESNVILNGDVTIADAYRFFPAPYQLAQGKVTGARLRAIIEENLNNVFSESAFDQKGGWFDGFSGIKLTINLNNDQESRIISLLRDDDTVITDDDVLTVSGCARPMDINATTTLCSYTGFTEVSNLDHPDKVGEVYPAVDLFIKAVKEDWINTYALDTRNSVIDVSTTQFWPDSEFIQPLN